MEQIALQEYCQEIEGLIERSAYDEAVAHCRHILQHYPKYIEAYRLLGKVALDREDDKQATELFARVLSADPADFVSRAGLSIIYDRQGSVRDASWQMERAYELAPGNAVVQEELRKLYARRDGVEPPKVPLTRGALARLYVSGELYTEAIAELRALLAQEPDRVDLQTLLAEVLWRDDQRLEAADTALKVLDRLPYCLDANLILSEIWTNSGREEDADVHLKRTQALDPLATRAKLLFGKPWPAPAQPVAISRLEYRPLAAAPTAEDTIPEWLTGIGGPAEPGLGGEEVPAWLQGVGLPTPEPATPLVAEPAPALKAAAPHVVQATPPVEEEIPDWLSGLGAPAAQPEVGALATEGEAAPDWLKELRGATPTEAEQPAAEEAVPDWLEQLGGPAMPEVEQPTTEESVPDWVARLRTEAGPVPGTEAETAPAAPTPESETPEWLQALQPPVAEQPAPPTEETAEGAPDWLSTLQTGTTPAEAAPEPAEIPDWLRALRPEGAEQPTPPAEQVPPSAPDWLSQMRAGIVPEAAPEAPLAAPEPAEIPDWLRALRPEGAEQPVPPVEQAPAGPDWLSEIGAGITPLPGMEAQAPTEETLPPPEPGEIPDWLKALEPQGAGPAPAAPVTPEPETPAWLTGEGPMPSPEEALAYFQKLTAGKEDELQARAQAEGEARMADIMGRKPAPTPTPPPPAPMPEPVTPPPAAVPPPPSVEETPAWLAGEGAMPSPEEALAYFQKLTAGKEAELQAQAQAEAVARMADIMGRKPAPTPAPAPMPEPVTPPPAAVPPPPPVEETQAGLTGEGAMPSPEEALAYFQKLTAGKEEELQARAQAEAEARMADIMGRKPAPTPAPPTPVAPVAVPPPSAPAEWEQEAPAEAAPPEAETPEWLAALMQVEAAPAAEITPTELPPAKEERIQVTPQAIGPEWWYQTLEDEEGPTQELVPEPALVEEKPIEPVLAAEVVPFAAPPPPPPPLAPEPKPVVPAPKKLVRGKPGPAAPPQPTVDIEALLARLRANPADYDALLGLARGWVQLGDLSAARGAYDELVRISALLDQVLSDLDKVTEDRPDDVEFIRLLGDAYMKAGNLQKALKLYRQALKKL